MMHIYVANKKGKLDNIRKKYPNASIFDITSTSEYRILQILSPFYPHGNIPIPGMPGRTATCVEAIWQGLKVFEDVGVDYETFRNSTMRNIKRSVRKYGRPVGHQYGDQILNYEDARWLIYLPTYLYVLENVPEVQHALLKIRERLKERDVVFLDYNTNCNVADYTKPLSHAVLVKLYLEGNYPTVENKSKYRATESCTTKYVSINDVVQAIEAHPKYSGKKHSLYLDQIRNMHSVDMESIVTLSSKRDGWKTIVRDIQRYGYGSTNQLSLALG